MNSTQQGNLATILEDIRQEPNSEIRYLLVATYCFDEQQLLNLACCKSLEDDFEANTRDMSRLALLRPLILCDAAAITEASTLPPFIEIHPWNQPGFGCHHSKAYCIITDTSVHLVLGSSNLTRNGLFHNREVLEHFCWTKEDGAHPQILHQWTKHVRDNYLARLADSAASVLREMTETLESYCTALPNLADTEATCALLASGYGETGLDALGQIWQQWYGEDQPHSALAVSPFFDTHPINGCVTDALRKQFVGLSLLTIVTDETVQPALCQRHFGGLNGTLYCIPITLDAEENREIQQRAAERHNSIADQVITRNLHAKLLLLDGPRGGLVYLGSANFTRNAWLGKNCELGLVWRFPEGASPQEAILTQLHVARNNRYENLPEKMPSEEPRDTEEASPLWQESYPKGIAHVVLRADEAMRCARFHIIPHIAETLHSEKYGFFWGHEQLVFTDHLSQWLPPDIWKPLLVQARYIEARPHYQPDAKKPLRFWLPFTFDGAIVAQGEALLLRHSLDWLLLHQSGTALSNKDDQGMPDNGGYEMPSDLGAEEALDTIDRTKNRVIAMQYALTLFARVEERYRCLLLNALESPLETTCTQHLARAFRPLEAFIFLLQQERSQQPAESLFKLGELALSLCRLADEPQEHEKKKLAHACLSPLLRRLDSILTTAATETQTCSQLLRMYIEFVHKLAATYLETSDAAS